LGRSHLVSSSLTKRGEIGGTGSRGCKGDDPECLHPTIDADEPNAMLYHHLLESGHIDRQSRYNQHLHPESTTHSSACLFKEAIWGSNDNGPILPTSSSIDAITENLNTIKMKYSATADVGPLEPRGPEMCRG
jgi:hypothetical protein